MKRAYFVIFYDLNTAKGRKDCCCGELIYLHTSFLSEGDSNWEPLYPFNPRAIHDSQGKSINL